MKTKIYRLALFLGLALLGIGGTQKQHVADLLLFGNAGLSSALPMEKVYVQTDKTFYLPGEDIWFSVYLVMEGDHTPSNISDVVYVELINPKGSVMTTRRLAVTDGNAAGDFQLGAQEPGGIYTLRAYTRWMKNFGEEVFFTKELTVQKVVTPRVLMKLDFEKEAYGSGDRVTADLSLRNLRDEPLSNLALTYSLHLAGALYREETMQTDEQGEAKISIDLPDQLTTNDGLLNVRLNFEGVGESISRSVPIVLNEIDLQFFPEGGTFVTGLTNRVAFKALNEFGKPADVSGVILDEQEREVATFESFHDGMGAFSFQPQAGETYRAKLLRPTGILQAFRLPAVQSNGIVMQVDEVTEETVRVQLTTSAKRNIRLVGHQMDTVFFARALSLHAGKNQVLIPTAKAYTGTALITLFDEAGIAQNERMVFLNAHRKLNIKLETDKNAYTPGEPVALTIRTTDESDQPVPARLSLSVVNDRLISFADDKQDHLLSYLLLSSDLKGDIHEPIFYFDHQEERAAEALEYVLMTHGWRTFKQPQAEPANPLAHQAETINDLRGTILRKGTDRPLKATVYAIEVGPDRKIMHTVTDKDGRFEIKGLNPAYSLVILATAPFRNRRNIGIQVDSDLQNGEKRKQASLNTVIGDSSPVPTRVEIKDDVVAQNQATGNMVNPGGGLDVALNESAEALSEVVVTGYGVVRRRDVVGVVTKVEAEAIGGLPSYAVGGLLQGRVTGIDIVENSGNTGNIPAFFIRGTGSISNDRPLIVMDGIPLPEDEAEGLLRTQEVSSVEVLKGPEAAALYGNRGVDGVILVNTRQHWWDWHNSHGRNAYAQRTLRADLFYQPRQFYQPRFSGKAASATTGENATVFWTPNVQTDQDGEAVITFNNSNEISNYRISVEGISQGGKLGRAERTLHTLLPLSVDTKIPPFMCFGDTVSIPLIIRNNTQQTIAGSCRLELPESFELLGDAPDWISIKPDSTYTEWISFRLGDQEGRFEVKVSFDGKDHAHQQTVEVEVLPMGFPVYLSLAGYDQAKQFDLEITDPVPGSLKATFSAYTNTLAELLDGLSSIIREPHGCFEQTSSYTYPNILALHLMRESGRTDPDVEKQALRFIKQGYKKLIGFETKAGGFEWFGSTPPHEGLTAYGLMEFYDMQQVYNGVDQQMVDRTVRWLLSRKNGNGSFKRNEKSVDSFGRSNQKVSDAYITYALTEIGKGALVIPEFEKAYAEAIKSQDAYRVALMANAALNMGKPQLAKKLTEPLVLSIRQDPDQDLNAEHSMVRSYGESLQVEIRALLLMALLRQDEAQDTDILTLVQYLASNRRWGGFGATQATILSLKALSLYAVKYRGGQGDGQVELFVNQASIGKKSIRENSIKAVTIERLENFLSVGKQSVAVQLNGTEKPIPYALDVRWMRATPDPAPDCKLAIRTQLNTTRLKLGETTRMEIELTNKTQEGLPMSMAIVGIPAGLSAQAWQLKELQEKKVFDFYEIRDNYLFLYYRQMVPEAVRSVKIDLKSESPGSFQAPASSAYLYYTPEDKHWVSGEQVWVGL